MKQLYNLTCILLSTACLQGCIKEIKQPSSQEYLATTVDRNAQTSKAGSLPTVSLKVTVLDSYIDALGNTIPYKIKSDNGQPYNDGIDNVKAQVDQNGNFTFNTNASKNSLPKRFVIYDLSDPVDPANTYSPAFGRGYYYQYNYLFTTSSSLYGTNPFVPIQNLAVGSSECIGLTGNINGDGVNAVVAYTVRFHASKDDLVASPTAFAVVTRVSDTQWNIQPSSCGSVNDAGALWTGDARNEISKGYFHLPFFFTLTKK